jgi:arylsulfatase
LEGPLVGAGQRADHESGLDETDHSKIRFTGTLHKVVVDVSGDLIVDEEAELRAHIARQ